MPLKSLESVLSDHLKRPSPVSVEAVQDHFANLILSPTEVDPNIPFEVSDALRECLVENDPINRVYEAIDRILSLQSRPEAVWKELSELSESYSDRSLAFRTAKMEDGTTLRSCYRVVSYLRSQGVIGNLKQFLLETEIAFSENGGRVESHNEYEFLARDLYTDLLVFGQAERLREMLGVPSSRFVVRDPETGAVG